MSIMTKRNTAYYDLHKPIYEIVMLRTKKLDEDEMPSSGIRVGFFHSLGEALIAVKENRGDIHEYTYDCAFIVTRYPGLYDDGMQRMYFEWNGDTGNYVEAAEPASLRHFSF